MYVFLARITISDFCFYLQILRLNYIVYVHCYYVFLSSLFSFLEPYTVALSQSSLIHLIGPSDCTLHGFVHGGNHLDFMIIRFN